MQSELDPFIFFPPGRIALLWLIHKGRGFIFLLQALTTIQTITQEFLKRGGRFCLSDDSHGVEQVGLNFHRVLTFLDIVGITTVHYLELLDDAPSAASTVMDDRFPRTQIRSIQVEEMKSLTFWEC